MIDDNFNAELAELKVQHVELAMRIYELEAIMSWSANDCSSNNNAMSIEAERLHVALSDQEQPRETHSMARPPSMTFMSEELSSLEPTTFDDDGGGGGGSSSPGAGPFDDEEVAKLTSQVELSSSSSSASADVEDPVDSI